MLSDEPPFTNLPLASLLIFSAVSLLSFSVGYNILISNHKQLSNEEKKEALVTQYHEMSTQLADSLGDFLIFFSGCFAVATLFIILSAIVYDLNIPVVGWAFKGFVFVIFIYCYIKLSHYILIKLKKMKSEIEGYKENESFLFGSRA